MPILARRIPDNFFYFGRRRKIRSVGGYLKDIRRDRMAAVSVKRPTGTSSSGETLKLSSSLSSRISAASGVSPISGFPPAA